MFDVNATDYWTIELSEYLNRDKRAYRLTEEQVAQVDALILKNPEVGAYAIKDILGFDVSIGYIQERKRQLGISKEKIVD